MSELDTGKRQRGKQKAPTKIPKYVRLKPEALKYLRVDEKGFAKRLDNALELIMEIYPEGFE